MSEERREDTALGLLKELIENGTPLNVDRDGCEFCGEMKCTEDCPWRRAKELVEAEGRPAG
jgi:hypothetical protein